MVESLGRIKNPFARSFTTAVTVGSAVAMTAAVVLGVANSKNESAYKAAVYASLIGAGCGAVAGFSYTGKCEEQKSEGSGDQQFTQLTNGRTWKDWRNFVVTRKVKESEEITSFYLQPQDKGEIPNFQPGQFLTIKLDIPGQANSVIRTYSLSDYAEPHNYYRLSIKREPMPAGLDVLPGVASNFMHDLVHEGTVIAAKPPSGKFILDVQKSIPAVLISNGVGITPMISMAKAVTRLNPNRPIWFLHGARNGDFHAFRDEISTIAQQNPNIKVHFAYSRPRSEDVQIRDTSESGDYHSLGYIDTVLIRSLIMHDAEYFLCGSPPFLASIREGLKDAGIPENRVFFESFVKAGKATSEQPPTQVSSQSEEGEIVFARSNKTIAWDANAESILDFAEANDLNPPYSCRQGICGTCMCKLLEGEVEYQETPTAEIDQGAVLICISKPKTSKVVLDL